MPFPLTITASKLDDWKTCQSYFEKRHILDCLPNSPNINLVSGMAIADGLYAARKAFGENRGISQEDQIHLAWAAAFHVFNREFSGDLWENHVRGLPNVCRKLELYLGTYFPLGSEVFSLTVNERDGAEAEFSAEAQIHPSLIHPDTGDPLLYAVRYDARINSILGPGILDDKSTRTVGGDGKSDGSWMSQWDLSSQMQGYLWMDRQWSSDPATYIIIRGIPMTRADDPLVELPPIMYNENQQKEWFLDLYQTVTDMLNAYAGKRRFTKALNWKCSTCRARDLCLQELLMDGDE